MSDDTEFPDASGSATSLDNKILSQKKQKRQKKLEKYINKLYEENTNQQFSLNVDEIILTGFSKEELSDHKQFRKGLIAVINAEITKLDNHKGLKTPTKTDKINK